MHELSLVEGILDAVREKAEERGGRVRSFKVRVGELAQFDVRVIRDLLAELRDGTPLQGARVTVEVEGAKLRCLSCNEELRFEDIARRVPPDEREIIHFLPELVSSYFRCPRCSKSYFEIREGRSVTVAEVVLDV